MHIKHLGGLGPWKPRHLFITSDWQFIKIHIPYIFFVQLYMHIVDALKERNISTEEMAFHAIRPWATSS